MNKAQNKIILLGDNYVGKTWLLNYNEFTPGYVPGATIGVNFYLKKYKLKNEQTVSCLFLDTSGVESYCSLFTVYFANLSIAGCLVIFDITCNSSFENAISIWLKFYMENSNITDPVVYLVGTKCDLEEKREVSYERAQITADDLGLRYFEVSSYLKYNVELLFQSLAEEMCTRLPVE